MDNKIKSKTRLAAIQLVAQQLINNQDIETIKDDFFTYKVMSHSRKQILKLEISLDLHIPKQLKPESCFQKIIY